MHVNVCLKICGISNIVSFYTFSSLLLRHIALPSTLNSDYIESIMPLLNNFSRSLACVTHAAAANASDERPKQRELAQEVKQRIKELWRVGSCWWLRKKSEKKGHEKLEINFTYDSGRERDTQRKTNTCANADDEWSEKGGEGYSIRKKRRVEWEAKSIFPIFERFSSTRQRRRQRLWICSLLCDIINVMIYIFSLNFEDIRLLLTVCCCFSSNSFYFFVKVRHQKLEYMTTTSTLWLNRLSSAQSAFDKRY